MEKTHPSSAEVIDELKAMAEENQVKFSQKRISYMQEGLDKGLISATALKAHTEKSIEKYKGMNYEWKDKDANDKSIAATFKSGKDTHAFIIERENNATGKKFFAAVIAQNVTTVKGLEDPSESLTTKKFGGSAFTKSNIEDVKSAIEKIEMGKCCELVTKEFKEVAEKIKEENSLETEPAMSASEPEVAVTEPQKEATGPELA